MVGSVRRRLVIAFIGTVPIAIPVDHQRRALDNMDMQFRFNCFQAGHYGCQRIPDRIGQLVMIQIGLIFWAVLAPPDNLPGYADYH